jgi:MFS family permease
VNADPARAADPSPRPTSEAPSAPLRSAWLVFSAAGLFVFYQFILQSLPSVIRSGLVVDFALSDAEFGGLSSSFYYPYMLLQIPAGLLVFRFGSRRLLLAGIALCIAACLVTATSWEVSAVTAARAVMGFGSAPTFVATMALVTQWFPARLFPVLVALTETLGMLGAGLGQDVLGDVVEHIGWRAAVSICAWVGVLVLVLIAAFVRDAPLPLVRDATDAGPRALGRRLRRLLSPTLILAGLIGGMIYSAGLAFAMLWGVPFFEQHLAVDLARASLCASFYSWGIVVGLPVFGWACGRLASPHALMAAGSVLTGAAVALILYAPPSFALSCAGMMACGLFSASYAIALVAVKADAASEDSGAALGLANMLIIAVGGLFLQPLIGVRARMHGRAVTDASSLGILVWTQLLALLLIVPLVWLTRARIARQPSPAPDGAQTS